MGPDLSDLSEQVAAAISTNAAGRSGAAAREFTAVIAALQQDRRSPADPNKGTVPVAGTNSDADQLTDAGGMPTGAPAPDQPDPDGEATALLVRAMLGLAASRYDIAGDLAEAERTLSEAAALAGAHRLAALQVAVRGQRALLLLRAGRMDEAEEAFENAAAVITEAEERDRTRILCNRGVLLLERGKITAARASLAQAAAAAAVEGDERIEAMIRHNLGYAIFLAGDLPGALSEMARAAQIVGDEPQPVMLLDRARVLLEAGLVRDAEADLTEAARIFRADRKAQDAAETDLVRAECALLAGRAQAARSLAMASRRRFARRENELWVRRAELLVLRCDRDRSTSGPTPGWVRRCQTFIADCATEGRHDLVDAARLLLAGATAPAGPDHSGPDEVAGLPDLRRGEPVRNRLERREVRARIHLASGRGSRASAEVRTGLAELARYRSGFGSLDLVTASAIHGRRLAHLGLGVALASGRPGQVLAVIERSRAAFARYATVRTEPGEASEALSQLRRLEDEERTQLGLPASDQARSTRSERIRQLQHVVSAAEWERRGQAARHIEVARIGDVRQAVRDSGTPYVCLTAHEGVCLAVVVRAGSTRIHHLGPVAEVIELGRRIHADLDALSSAGIPAAIRPSVSTSLQADLARLESVLLGPLGPFDGPLVLGPTGALATLPWSLLPSRTGLATVVVDSATNWLRTPAPPAATEPAGPGAVLSVQAVAGPGLERAGEEIGALARHWPRAQVHHAATGAEVRRMLASASLMHVAAHGHHRPDNPLFSSVRLQDGPLYAHELDDGDPIAACVILSACELGRVVNRPGDQPLGLANVLTRLGTRSVLASVATVADDAAAEVMDSLHARLSGGTDTATALAGALAERGQEADQAPAPFTCFGGTWAAPAPSR